MMLKILYYIYKFDAPKPCEAWIKSQSFMFRKKITLMVSYGELLVHRQSRFTVVDMGGNKVALHNAKTNRRSMKKATLNFMEFFAVKDDHFVGFYTCHQTNIWFLFPYLYMF